VRRRKKVAPGSDLLATLKAGILRVLEDEKSTAAERMRAIEIGAKIVGIERKSKDGDDESGSFFD
jgi:hypothetical protein